MSTPVTAPFGGESNGNIPLRLFVFGFQVLFLELLLIRFLAGHIWNLGYFPNLVLLSAFIGFGFGFLLHGRFSARMSARLYAFLPVFLLLFVLLILWLKPPGFIGLDEIASKVDGELFFTDSNSRVNQLEIQFLKFLVWFLGVVAIFLLIGQRMAKLFRLLAPLRAYSLDISGSLAGIVLFMLVSHFQVSASVWFLVFGASYWLATGSDVRVGLRACSLCAALALSVVSFALDNPELTPYGWGSHESVLELKKGGIEAENISERSAWSPYQRLTLIKMESGGRILANGIAHQTFGFLNSLGERQYAEAHGRREELGEEPFEDVLVIGSGSGNDVLVALLAGASRIDAVEIDPGILAFGYHERYGFSPPYFDPRVEPIVDDGRHYLYATQREYDMIVFALTDSLVKVSSVSQLRLENYLYTENAFRRAAELLKPGGWLVLYNAYREQWLIDKLEQMLSKALPSGSKVEVVSYAKNDWNWGVLIGRTPYSPDAPLSSEPPVDYGMEPSTDDWPFPYIKERKIPIHYLIAMTLVIGMVLVALSVLGRRAQNSNPSLAAAFTLLGAAFLLLETKGVVQFSLLFGTTWLNNSLVFFAVLVSVLLGIRVAEKVRSPRLLPLASILLLLSACVSLAVPLDALLAFAPAARFALAGALMFTPIFMANLVFSILFRERADAELYFGWNLLGATAGGVLEYVSIATGYQALGAVVVALYVAALYFAWAGTRTAGNLGARSLAPKG